MERVRNENVSLSSGSKITDALRAKGHEATMIDLFLGYDLQEGQTVEDVFKTSNTDSDYEIQTDVLTDADIEKLRTDGTVGLFGKNVLESSGLPTLFFSHYTVVMAKMVRYKLF